MSRKVVVFLEIEGRLVTERKICPIGIVRVDAIDGELEEIIYLNMFVFEVIVWDFF